MLLTCFHLVKRFGSVRALDDVSLEVHEGRFVCILGPSGCGKSTLLRVVAGLETPDAGRVYLKGQDITRWIPAQREFGIVFQSYALFPNLTALENVMFGIRGVSRLERRKRAGEMLELVRLSDAADRYPSQLSGGQQQRVALARALAIRPRLLLLDEPLSALDARVRADLREELRRLHRTLGITTVMVTHDQEEALSLADEVVVMKNGRVRQNDRPHRIYRKPGDLFVADFIGAMNVLRGWRAQGDQVYRAGMQLRVREGAPATNESVIVGIRPEEIQLVNGSPCDNVIIAEVKTLEFRGPFYRVRCALRPGEEAETLVLTAHWPATLVEPLGLKEGDRVRLRLPPEALLIYTDGTSPVLPEAVAC